KCGRDAQAKRPRGFEIDHQLVLCWRLHRQLARLLAAQNAVNVACRSTPLLDLVGPIGHQSALSREKSERIDCRQAMARRQQKDRSTVRIYVDVRHDNQTAIWLACEPVDGALNLDPANYVDSSQLDSKRWRHRLGGAQEPHVGDGIRTEQNGHATHIRCRLLEHSQPFAADRRLEILETGDIGAWSRKARDEAAAV